MREERDKWDEGGRGKRGIRWMRKGGSKVDEMSKVDKGREDDKVDEGRGIQGG